MSNYETIYLLEHSIEQINALRRTVEELEPRAHAYDTITQILALREDRRDFGGRVDAYPTDLPDAVQHNAWWDAMALRKKLLGQDHHDPLDLRPATTTGEPR